MTMQNKAKQYSAIKHRIALINILLTPALLWIFLIAGLPAYFKSVSQLIPGNDYTDLVIFYILVSAFYCAISLPLEFYSLKTTGDISAFISTMKKLGEQNLADTSPGRFYEIMLYDHPPIARRIAFAESYKQSAKNGAHAG